MQSHKKRGAAMLLFYLNTYVCTPVSLHRDVCYIMRTRGRYRLASEYKEDNPYCFSMNNPRNCLNSVLTIYSL